MTYEDFSKVVAIRTEARADTMLSMLPYRNIDIGGGNLKAIKEKLVSHFRQHLRSRIHEYTATVDEELSVEANQFLDDLATSECEFLSELYYNEPN